LSIERNLNFTTKGTLVNNVKLMLVLACAAAAGCNASQEQEVKLNCKYSRVTTVEKAGTRTTVQECLPDPAETLALLEQAEAKKQPTLEEMAPEPLCVQEVNGETRILPLAECENDAP
jgi:hypothetical protein